MAQEALHFHAGPWAVWWTAAAGLRHLRFGSAEILERVYPTVRDRNWGTVEGRIEEIQTSEGDSSFEVRFRSTHRAGPIDFVWSVVCRADAEGVFTVDLSGEAQSSFWRNRLGLSVHHPLENCLGNFCTVETVDGSRLRSRFPVEVAPWQPFVSIRSLVYRPEPELQVELEFSGDVFETEDHRNWTDNNYKTYCTPLAQPFPVYVPAGTRIEQHLLVRVGGAPRIAFLPPPDREGACAGDVGHPPCVPGVVKGALVRSSSDRRVVHTQGGMYPRPALGLVWNTRRLPTTVEIERLRRLRLDHVRVEWGASTDPDDLLLPFRLLGTPLEVVVRMPCDLRRLRCLAPLVLRWLLYTSERPTSDSAMASAAREVLGPQARLIIGTDFHFAELNRNRPENGAWDGLTFSACPQVHSQDDESVMANADGVYWPVRTAQGFAFGKPVGVSPITLRPRNNPAATTDYTPPDPDPRQREPFCAAWTVASLCALVSAGAKSATYFATHGPGGVQDGDDVYPVYSVFAAFGEIKSQELEVCEVDTPGDVAALVLRRGGLRRWIVANRLSIPLEIVITDLERVVDLAPYEVAVVDQR